MLTLKVVLKPRFRKDYALCMRRGLDVGKVDNAMRSLAAGVALPASMRDHALKGDMRGLRECHLSGDWVLVYRRVAERLELEMIRTGYHRELGLGS